MITRNTIVQEAESWIGTPYAHYQRCKQAGVDCIQFIAGVAENLGIVNDLQIPYYSPQWHLTQKEELLFNSVVSYDCTQILLRDALPGDIILFRFARKQPCAHSGLLVEHGYFIHSLLKSGRVVKHRFAHEWKNKWAQYYFSYPGVK